MIVRFSAGVLLATAVMCVGSVANAQPATAGSGGCIVPARPEEAAISSAQYGVTQPCLDSLRVALNLQDYDKALRIYFGGTYSPKLANWVVYIAADGTVRQAVVQNGRPRHLLRGEKYVYAAVFMDEPPVHDPANFEGPALELSRRSMNFSKEAFTTFMVSTFGAGRLQGNNEPVRTVMDIDRPVKLRPITQDSTHTLWFGSARLEVGDNTDVQLSLSALGKERLPGTLTRVYTTLNNAKPSLWELGLTIGSSFGPRIIGDDMSGEYVKEGAQSNIYASSYLNLVRPHLPRTRRSLGLVFGTNLTRGNIMDELLAGVGVGRLIGDAGLVLGGVWQEVKISHTNLETGKQRTESKRVPRVFVGFDLRM